MPSLLELTRQGARLKSARHILLYTYVFLSSSGKKATKGSFASLPRGHVPNLFLPQVHPTQLLPLYSSGIWENKGPTPLVSCQKQRSLHRTSCPEGYVPWFPLQDTCRGLEPRSGFRGPAVTDGPLGKFYISLVFSCL